MSRITTVCRLLLNKAEQKYGSSCPSPDGGDDILADRILKNIESHVIAPGFCSEERTFDFDFENDLKDNDDAEDDNDPETGEAQNSHSQESSQEWENLVMGAHTFTMTEIRNILKFYDSCRTNKFEKTVRRYPRVRDRQYITRFREYLYANGTKAEKLDKLEGYVLQKFILARSNFLPVRGLDIRRWALAGATEFSLDFSASVTWLTLFKRRNRIVGRTITKYTTYSEQLNTNETKYLATSFVETTKRRFAGVRSAQIFNIDQSGFNYELTTKRTLSHRGERQTFCLISSQNAMTHSYSIMPILSMSGNLRGKLLICLQENTGELGPRVSQSLRIPDNISLVTSKSGKLEKRLMKEWVDTSFSPLVQENSILILDSWTGQLDDVIFENILETCTGFYIPPKTTPLRQPLDRYFFRQFKIFAKRISERVVMDEISVNLQERGQILKLHSLIYNQRQAKSFEPLLRYSWLSCGYVDNRAGRFDNLTEILFSGKG